MMENSTYVPHKFNVNFSSRLFVNVCLQVGGVWLFFNLMLMFSSRLILISGCGYFQLLWLWVTAHIHFQPVFWSMILNQELLWQGTISSYSEHWGTDWKAELHSASKQPETDGRGASWRVLGLWKVSLFLFVIFFRWDKGENVERK